MLANGTRDGDIALRDARTGRVQARLPRHGRALALAFQPGGAALALGTEGGVKVIDLASGAARTPEWDIPAVQRQELVSALAYTPDGTRLLAGYGTRVYVWDARTLKLAAPPLAGVAGDRFVRQLHVSPGGRWLLAAYNDGWTAGIWELKTLLLRKTLTNVAGAAFSRELLATGDSAGHVTLWNASTLEPLGEPALSHHGEVRALAFNPSGDLLVSGATDASVRFWRTGLPSWRAAACGRAERNLSGPEWCTFLAGLPYHKACPDYPVEASALELLAAQADAAYGRGEPQHAATLLGRARRYALASPALAATFCRQAGGQLGCAEAEAGD